MKLMNIATPSYWQEERFQPLVEVQTAYGNKVKIPENCLPLWEMLSKYNKEKAAQYYEQVIADGSFDSRKPIRNKTAHDLIKVFVEKYQI